MTSPGKTVTGWQEETALSRYQMISPLLEEGLDRAKRIQRRKDIAVREGISERTLRPLKKWRLWQRKKVRKSEKRSLLNQKRSPCKDEHSIPL